MTADVELLPCGECGMPCRPGEYHPYAACLMFKTCRNSDTVRGNLQDAQDHATAAKDAEVEALRAEVESVTCELMDAITRADKLAEALRDAEKSLRTIANLAGGTEYLMTIGDVRGYANSRAYAARTALRDHDQEGK